MKPGTDLFSYLVLASGDMQGLTAFAQFLKEKMPKGHPTN